MKTYTGPTIGGATATIQCPSWCVTDHAYWDDDADDCFHQGAPLELDLPRDRARYKPVRVPALTAELRLHSTDPSPAAASVWAQFSEFKEDGLELDLAGVDHLLQALDDYRAGLVRLRGQLDRLDTDRRTNR
ncbi:DUF6907 domain-containing protein [Streptomyces showdoensis]|uniref:Uncharacterized protein n=1 Tax=Streptomyces showdoensis TaxID=68268 RepID=A0A2P2GS68_STREW|nr:hypothetical protein [Streptomyces showdoensis]KKZ74337.1 hypothetical protein VO63_07775 [Streptomyces showdoensis]